MYLSHRNVYCKPLFLGLMNWNGLKVFQVSQTMAASNSMATGSHNIEFLLFSPLWLKLGFQWFWELQSQSIPHLQAPWGLSPWGPHLRSISKFHNQLYLIRLEDLDFPRYMVSMILNDKIKVKKGQIPDSTLLCCRKNYYNCGQICASLLRS